jgi:hypothetical protein
MYVVRQGETAKSICAALSLDLEELQAANPEVRSKSAGTKLCYKNTARNALPLSYQGGSMHLMWGCVIVVACKSFLLPFSLFI